MAFAASLAEGDQFYQSGQAESACNAWSKAFSLALTDAERCAVAGRFLSLGFLAEAEEALSLCQVSSASLIALRSSLALERGEVETSLTFLDDEVARDNLTLMSNALLVTHYLTPENPLAIKNNSLLWAAKAKVQRDVLPARSRSARGSSKPLRMGFMSGDLCAHPVGFLIGPILQALAARPDDVELFIFDNGVQNDWVTDRLKSFCGPDHWHMIRHLNDDDASQIIFDTELDVLVDCSGHTSRSRIGLLTHRLAPLQISWGGYFSTTGLDTIDAVIMDRFHAPEGSEAHFVEKIVHVPSRFIYAPPPACPPVTDAPYFRNGVISFGSFNNIAKINDDVVKTWSSILNKVPGSRLILKWRCFADSKFCDFTKHRFVQHGIESGRIILRPFSIYRDTLAEYRDVDIALDPFPFTGGQTSLDALWMGVPLVTMAGRSPVARQGHAFVNLIGKSEWSSSNESDYIQCALTLARDPHALRTMRFDQRTLIHHSKLSDASSFVDVLINAIQKGDISPSGLKAQ